MRYRKFLLDIWTGEGVVEFLEIPRKIDAWSMCPIFYEFESHVAVGVRRVCVSFGIGGVWGVFRLKAVRTLVRQCASVTSVAS